jgi:hypothetical protein
MAQSRLTLSNNTEVSMTDGDGATVPAVASGVDGPPEFLHQQMRAYVPRKRTRD